MILVEHLHIMRGWFWLRQSLDLSELGGESREEDLANSAGTGLRGCL